MTFNQANNNFFLEGESPTLTLSSKLAWLKLFSHLDRKKLVRSSNTKEEWQKEWQTTDLLPF